jgi:hypothetical protein
MFPIRKFVSVEETDDGRFEFEFVCGTEKRDLGSHTLILHRMKPFPEMLGKMMGIFGRLEEKEPTQGRASLPVTP